MAKKLRVPIPDEIAAEILFLSDRTCSVCNERGKQVQIHHIDENPSNNAIENLCILCFECHDQTMIKGGFGRKLEANQILLYRSEWLVRVKARKDKADEIASIQTVTGSTENVIVTTNDEEDFLDCKTYDDINLLKHYLGKIIGVHQAQLTIAQTKWDTGVTMIMINGNSDMVDFYEEVLIELSTFYPKGHFNNQSPKNYFSELTAAKYQWHRLVLEPHGVGTGGTIVSIMTGGNVMRDLKEMIIDMVDALLWPNEIEGEVDLIKWHEEWRK